MQVEINKPLRAFNSFGIEAYASFFTTFAGPEELEEVIAFADKKQLHERLVLGGGSNILLTRNVDGLVLKNEIKGISVYKEDEAFVYIRAGAGENWHRFVLFCVEHGFAGLENLSLIPGNVGASPMQNIGAYGVEVKDVFQELEAFHVQERNSRKFSLEECRFGYRESIFKNQVKGQYIITHVSFRLRKKPQFNISYGAIQQELEKMGVQSLSIKAVSDAVISIRSSKLPDPSRTGNAGSFFKNPVVAAAIFESLKSEHPGIAAFPLPDGTFKLAAGWLIEQCGWKGYRKGDAGCYPLQALVLVNYGNATGSEIYQLSQEIIASVEEKFGVTLEREVNII